MNSRELETERDVVQGNKRLAFVMSVCLGLGASLVPVRAQETSAWSADERAMRELAEAWKVHYNAGDAARVAALYTADAYYVSAHVLAHGRDAIEAYWRQGIAAGGHIDRIEPLLVSHTGPLGYAVGRYQATNAGVTVDGRVLIVMKKVGGAWLMAAHQTVVRDQPETGMR